MGLDTSHECWHGSYGSFRVWRNALAVAAGIPLDNAEYSYELPWNEFTLENFQGEWDRVPGDDPLLYLLVHSDCDGVIHPEQGRHIARRLRELAPKLVDHPLWSMRDLAIRFAEGLEQAAEAGEDVDFH